MLHEQKRPSVRPSFLLDHYVNKPNKVLLYNPYNQININIILLYMSVYYSYMLQFLCQWITVILLFKLFCFPIYSFFVFHYFSFFVHLKFMQFIVLFSVVLTWFCYNFFKNLFCFYSAIIMIIIILFVVISRNFVTQIFCHYTIQSSKVQPFVVLLFLMSFKENLLKILLALK